MSDLLLLADSMWGRAFALAAIVWGLITIWHGLVGEADGARGLVRRKVRMLQRMEGFRRVVVGLVLVGLGGAVLAQASWLLWLALGVGFVEILESSTLIAVWKLRPPAAMRN